MASQKVLFGIMKMDPDSKQILYRSMIFFVDSVKDLAAFDATSILPEELSKTSKEDLDAFLNSRQDTFLSKFSSLNEIWHTAVTNLQILNSVKEVLSPAAKITSRGDLVQATFCISIEDHWFMIIIPGPGTGYKDKDQYKAVCYEVSEDGSIEYLGNKEI